jgi:hypothetical protein
MHYFSQKGGWAKLKFKLVTLFSGNVLIGCLPTYLPLPKGNQKT